MNRPSEPQKLRVSLPGSAAGCGKMTPYDVPRFGGDGDVEPTEPPFRLVDRPGGDPSVHAFLPADSYVPVPFESTKFRRTGRTVSSVQHTEGDRQVSEHATVVYAPGGEVGTLERHAACRVSIVEEFEGQADFDAIDVATAHEEVVGEMLWGDQPGEFYSDWVTETYDEETVSGHPRSVYTIRRPRLVGVNVPSSVRRPVVEQAAVVQSTDWGLVETGAYLTPKPDEGRAREVATEIADVATTQAIEYGPPEATELASRRARENPEE